MAYDPKLSLHDMIAAMYDPVIVFPGGWGESLPDWLRGEIELERMALVMKGAKEGKRPDMGTDAEALAYMYTASFAAPWQQDVVDVYLWLGKKVMGDKYKEPFQKDIPKKLPPHQQQFLDDLKRWIWTKRLGTRKR